MSANPGFSGIPESTPFASARDPRPSTFAASERLSAETAKSHTVLSAAYRPALSRWSGSGFKRVFDILAVTATLPVALPVLLATAVAVRLTSPGPVLFRQQRMGRHGKAFTIFKFRTMPVRRAGERPSVTTSINQRFTPVGPFLRRWTLDELPQIFNVLRGDMSLVGPRPKLPKHQSAHLMCRPGITGRATVVFAREEVTLSAVPNHNLESYYHGVILPLKQSLDDEYMARATFRSDIKLIVKSLLRSWDDVALTDLPSLSPQLSRFAVHTRISVDRPGKPHSSPAIMPAPQMSLGEVAQGDLSGR